MLSLLKILFDSISLIFKNNESSSRFLEDLEKDYQSQSIQKVIIYLQDKRKEMPSRNDREMFLKFFERIHLQIKKKLFGKSKYKKEVYMRFAHYAIEASKDESFMLGLKEHTSFDCWKNFKDFVNEMIKIENEIYS